MKEKEPHEPVSVIVFTFEDLDAMNDKLGPTQTLEIFRYLGEYINKHFGHVGISNRIGTDQIATILPNSDHQTVARMLEDFKNDVIEKGLGGLRTEEGSDDSSPETTFSISAGLTLGEASEDIEVLSERARSNKKTILRYMG